MLMGHSSKIHPVSSMSLIASALTQFFSPPHSLYQKSLSIYWHFRINQCTLKSKAKQIHLEWLSSVNCERKMAHPTSIPFTSIYTLLLFPFWNRADLLLRICAVWNMFSLNTEWGQSKTPAEIKKALKKKQTQRIWTAGNWCSFLPAFPALEETQFYGIFLSVSLFFPH